MPNLISETRLMWNMPITVAIVEPISSPSPLSVSQQGGERENSGSLLQQERLQTTNREARLISQVFAYFEYIDDKFSTYKPNSEISFINQGALTINEASYDMHTVFALAEELRLETNGYFNISHNGKIDPSGLVKGWALSKAADMLRNAGCENFHVEAGGDFQAVGVNAKGQPWRVGIRNPFNTEKIVKVLTVKDRGVATSGTYIRGQHIYNPVTGGSPDPEILSITVIGSDVYEADCYATAAFAMGRDGIGFIESLEGFEGYMIDSNKQATFTSGFVRYVSHENH
jgi:thiamine biosynthesis lipoprotein